jgi:PKD repeat protein
MPFPVAHFTPTGICGSSGTTFTDKTNTLGYPITNWSWNFGDGSASVNVQNPVHPFATNGSYHVILTVNNANGCSGTLDSLITIYNVIADFNYTTACKNDSIQFTDNSVFPASTYGVKSFWNFGGTGTYSATSVSSSIPPRNPKWLFGSNVVYNVTHIVTSSIGCIDTIVKAVSVHPKPTAFFSFGTACIGAPTNLFDLSVISGDSITKWDWSFATLPNDTIKNPIHVFNNLGNNSINLMVTSSNGCKDNTSNTIVVNPSPIANFTFTPNVGSPPLAVTFVNTSSGALYSNWDFGDNSYSSSTNPIHTYMDTLVYHIALTETNSFGCTKTKTDSIHVSKPILDIAVENVTAILKNNYLNVIAKLHNVGTVNIDSLDLYVSINNGPRIKENWTKGLAASGIDQQTLTTSIYLTDSKHFVCVTALKPNGVDDINANNNEACEAVDVSTFDALDPYPNPANDFLTLPLIIPSKNNLQIVLYDARGEILRIVFSGIIPEGLQMLTVNTNELNAGLYVFKIEYNNQLLMKKFIKR